MASASVPVCRSMRLQLLALRQQEDEAEVGLGPSRKLSGSAGFGHGLNVPTSSFGGNTVFDLVCARTGMATPPSPLGPSLTTLSRT